MANFYIPDRTIEGHPVNLPGNPAHGRILFKYKSGILPGMSGAPNWTDWEFSGTPQTTLVNFEPIPAPTRNVWYVSDSSGNDNNLGSSPMSPFKSLAKALTVMGQGDHVYLRRGDKWLDQALHPVSANVSNYLKSGISTSERSVLSWYGTSGARPIISSGSTLINTFDRGGLKHLIIDGIHFHSKHRDITDPAFYNNFDEALLTHAASKGVTIPENVRGGGGGSANMAFRSGNTLDITIHDCIFDHAELTFEDNSKNNQYPGYPTDIRVINNIFTGAYEVTTYTSKNARPSNFFCTPCLGLTIRGNTFDYGGWNPFVPGASANQYIHNMYLAASTNPDVTNSYLIENNIVCRGGSHGLHCRPGGTVRDNFFSRNSVNLQVGYGSSSATAMGAGALPLVENNVVSECWSMWKGWNGDSLFESSYTVPGQEDPMRSGAKWGFDFENYGGALITARNNIAQIGQIAGDIYVKGSTNTVGFNTKGGALHVNQNNLVWQFPNQSGSYPSPGRTLGAYFAHLNGAGDFDAFMTTVKSRPLRGWDERYTARGGINPFVREGYQP